MVLCTLNSHCGVFARELVCACAWAPCAMQARMSFMRTFEAQQVHVPHGALRSSNFTNTDWLLRVDRIRH